MKAQAWRRSLVGLIALLFSSAGSIAVGDEFLEQYAETYRFRLGRPGSIRPTPDGGSVLFLRSGPRSFVRDLYELDLKTGAERKLLSAEAILRGAEEELTAEERARRERMRLAARGIASYQLSTDGKRILVPLSGRLFVVARDGGEIKELASEAGFPIDPQLSPDGRMVACVREGDLYVTDITSGRERRLTRGASETLRHGLAEFVAAEEMSRHHGFWWAPDSARIVYQQTDTSELEVMNIADATHPERPPDRWPYPRPGKVNARVRLGILPVEGGETTWIEWDRERFEYLAGVKWPARAPLTLTVQNRKQTELRLLTVDPADGSTTTLLTERDAAWIDLDQKMPFWLHDGSGFLWMTEREGAWQLERRGAGGELLRALTPVDFGLQAFEHYHDAPHSVIVRASQNPTRSDLYRVPLDRDFDAPVRITEEEDGTHAVVSSGSRGPVYVQLQTSLDGSSRYRVANWSGPGVGELRSVAEQPPFRPNLEFTTVGSDPAFHAVLVRPREFEPRRRYPVIVHVYGGPTSLMVRRVPGRYLLDQWIADHGYVVVATDGRGTPYRGRAWHRAVKNDLIGIPLEDQVTALGLLGARYEELDLSRVGIYGWSFGGYVSTMAVMRRPQIFHAGLAGAPVVDWADYDTHYTERYLDLPQDNPEGYRASNVLTYAADLTRPLLIVHGTADDNVYFTHSLKLAQALFRHGRDFDFLPLAGFTHMVPDPVVTQRLYGRLIDHFDRHLARPASSEAPR